MPAVFEQVERMSVSDKMRLMEYLVRSLSITVVQYENVPSLKEKRRIGAMAGKWRLPTEAEDRAMDAERESMFERLQEGK